MITLATSTNGLVHYVPAPKTACGLRASGRVLNNIANVTCPECLAKIEAVKKVLECEAAAAPQGKG